MIYLGIGSNLASEAFGAPIANCRAAIAKLAAAGLAVHAISQFYETAPVPVSDQPWYVNCVVAIKTGLSPRETLGACLGVEAALGRVRTIRNAARIVDIDLLAWHDLVVNETDLVIPHPRMHERAFVLLPLADIAPDWRHPALCVGIRDLIAQLPPDQMIRPLNA